MHFIRIILAYVPKVDKAIVAAVLMKIVDECQKSPAATSLACLPPVPACPGGQARALQVQARKAVMSQ